MNLDDRNYYEVLGLNPDASARDIEAAFLHMHSLYAPGGSQSAPLNYEYILQAYEVLRDPKRRKRYDALLAEVYTPIVTKARISRDQLAISNEPQMVYLLVELRPREQGDHLALPLNLCLVIDRSTSMQGDRLQRVKQALSLLLPKLSAGDNLSVVSFSDRADIVLFPGPVGEHDSSLRWIDGITASGGTEIYQGLLTGVRQLRKASLREYNNQLILLTDGRTYGDESKCLQLAEEVAGLGITIHAFGIGTDWDDNFLDALVRPSGGLVEYIDSPEKIVEALQRKLQGLGETHARRVTLRAEWPRSMELLDGFRLTPYAQPLRVVDDSIALGDIEGRTSLSFVLAFSIMPQPIAVRIRIPLIFSAELPGQGIHTFEEQIELSVSPDPPPFEPHQSIIKAVRLLTLYRLNERAWEEIESGQMEVGIERMRNLSTRLLEAGEPDLARQADLEARQLVRTGRLSTPGRKKITYGTRALTRKTIQLEWDDSM